MQTDDKTDNETRNTTLARYQRAQQLEQGAYTKKVAFNTTLYPHWIGDQDCFWYVRDFKQGKEYRLVDADKGSNEVAFDHQALAKLLSDVSGERVESENLPLNDLELSLQPMQISFSAFTRRWLYQPDNGSCTELETHPDHWLLSPDGRQALITRDHNLWLRNLNNGEEKALTQDGDPCFVYAGTATVFGRQEAVSVEAIWSPDGKRIFTLVVDTRNVKVGPPLVQHVPTDGSLRPKILNAQRKVGFSEDKHIEVYRLLSIEVASGAITWADCAPSPVCYPPYWGYFTGGRGWWSLDSQTLYALDLERGGKTAQLLAINSQTGRARALITEQADTGVSLIPCSHLGTLITPLPDTQELIWYSERSGWAHLYLYDLATGTLKHSITSGNWLVRNLLHLDRTRRELWIQTCGREPGRNPYYGDICRVNIDSGELTTVLSTDHDYAVCDHISRSSTGDIKAQGVSPSGHYAAVTRSRVDQAPEFQLLDRQGEGVLTFEQADISGLPDNWQWPEPVMVKADDGETDLYAVLFRPSDFDSSKRYPVLDCTWSSFTPVGSFTNNTMSYLSAAAYAELGFIVIMVNQRGGGLRSRAFKAHQDPNLAIHPMSATQYGKTDCIAVIKQLAKRYAYLDVNRVGIAEFASVPTALTGLLVHPDFYQVGVCMLPKADWRMMGALGRDNGQEPGFEQFAPRLQGKLLLIAGMLDDVMSISMTFRLVEALKQANKNFDMLLLPNLGHELTGYETRRAWDYLVEHLLGETPPTDFQLITGLELLMAEQQEGPLA